MLTSFAVAGGTGGLGSFIVQALVAKGNAVVVLSRTATATTVPGATVKAVDYTSPKSLEAALEGVQVVISALNAQGLALQPALADAAKRANVELFVPSEFGNPTEGVISGPLKGKADFAAYLKEIGIPSLRVFTGPFPDFLLVPFTGFDFAKGTAKWVGKGDTPIGFTTRRDVAAFVVHAITTLLPSKLFNSILRIEGDRKTFNEVVQIYERSHPGQEIIVSRTPVEQAEKTIATDQGLDGFLAFLFLSWEQGAAVYSSGPLDNHLFPEWKPTSIEALLATYPNPPRTSHL